MADIDISRPHQLGPDELRRATDEVAARLQSQFGVTTRREGDAVRVEGKGVRGRLVARPDEIRVTASLGLLARPFRRALEGEIERELDRYTRPA